MANYNAPTVRESEFNELQLKIFRINKLQDGINDYWKMPKQRWLHERVVAGQGEYGFVLIASSSISLYKEVRPKCTEEEKQEMDDLKNEIDNLVELGEEAIMDKVKNYDKEILKYNHNKWIKLKHLLDDFENKVKDLLDTHGYNPDKNNLQGL